ncbi:hypothetical protein [Actinocrispum wychmicini]|uniref:Uncharacterized protein n=1 Tax=Actinocrispum wychmicini TaxID=1213861 RepID=A0A4R2JT49_9PSEU|nr:hypothetical protein [Actinocrispum wychmicini]TCO62132.1 hypothetical protein EV192_102269 [Actinocrispum wychmicini]
MVSNGARVEDQAGWFVQGSVGGGTGFPGGSGTIAYGNSPDGPVWTATALGGVGAGAGGEAGGSYTWVFH